MPRYRIYVILCKIKVLFIGKVIQKNKILINYIVSDSSSFVKEKDAYFLTILIQIIKGENNDK